MPTRRRKPPTSGQPHPAAGWLARAEAAPGALPALEASFGLLPVGFPTGTRAPKASFSWHKASEGRGAEVFGCGLPGHTRKDGKASPLLRPLERARSAWRLPRGHASEPGRTTGCRLDPHGTRPSRVHAAASPVGDGTAGEPPVTTLEQSPPGSGPEGRQPGAPLATPARPRPRDPCAASPQNRLCLGPGPSTHPHGKQQESDGPSTAGSARDRVLSVVDGRLAASLTRSGAGAMDDPF